MLSWMYDILYVLTAPGNEAVPLYDRLGPRYDRLHRRWLKRAGLEPLAALLGCLAAELRPGARVLDAGCGTGALARWIAETEPAAQLTMVDLAPAMLARAADVPGRHVRASLLALPFSDAEFDIVICAWALETTEDPERVVAELDRVLRAGGLVCLCYCTAPNKPAARLGSLALRLAVTRLFRGAFLCRSFPERLAPGPLRRLVSRRGLASFTCWRKPLSSERRILQ